MLRPRFFCLLFSPLLFTACSSAPLELDPQHPASAEASPGRVRPARSVLPTDDATRRTRALLATRDRQMRAAESEKPTTPLPAAANLEPAAPASAPTVEDHEHH